MQTTPPRFLAAGTLALTMFAIAACGKKNQTAPEQSGPQSPQGGILESAQKTADEANERSRKVKERVDAARE